MMAQGGHGIHGFPPRGTHPEMLAPTNPLVMWAFTNLADDGGGCSGGIWCCGRIRPIPSRRNSGASTGTPGARTS